MFDAHVLLLCDGSYLTSATSCWHDLHAMVVEHAVALLPTCGSRPWTVNFSEEVTALARRLLCKAHEPVAGPLLCRSCLWSAL